MPLNESLETTVERVVPYYNEVIVPAMKAGKRCIIAAHGNSLRALVKYLDNMSDEEIINLNIPTGVPLVYEFDEDLKVTGHYYLGDQEALKAAMEAVANQGKKK
jgi:2,3-bisphosphoglycerate-dependent phosphoglycerate mutase